MKNLYPPYIGAKLGDVSQGFWAQQIQGGYHQGVDFSPANGYGKFLLAPELCRVERIITDDTLDNDFYPKLERGYGIILTSLINTNIKYLYWHCQQCFPVKAGDIVEGGKPVGCLGNSGLCYANGKYVALRDRASGKGAHLHYERRDARQDPDLTNPVDFIDFAKPVKLDILRAVQQQIIAIQNLILNRK
jgi:murein DD-endopeptidase MepM/ murein hydrolase activator NlpD